TNLVSSSTGYIMKKDSALKNMDSSLAGYWDMETLTSSGLLKDLSGNGNDGVFSGGMSSTGSLTGGIVGRGMSFSNSGYSIEVPDTVTGSILDITGDFTQEIVIYYSGGSSVNSGPIFFSKGIYPNYNYKLAFFNLTNKKNQIEFTMGIDGVHTSVISYPTSGTGNWYHIAGTYRNTTKEMKIYVNGKWNGSYTVSGAPGNNNYPLIFGKYFGTTGYSLAGIIDDVKLYKKTLSDSEIRQHAQIAGF
ncbi:MAG: LamG domain-containing protein, partial [Candidatus Gracilibacteria bacterium]|nr:LamG domain-containing protein [Candidatus Gracilibacteria bacterium]